MTFAALTDFDSASPSYATDFCDSLLSEAVTLGVSDIHLQPTAEGIEIDVRLDGVLQRVGSFPAGETALLINRLKVMAELLTYRADVPQEGRIRNAPHDVEMRVSTFPTLYGERLVIRLFAADRQFRQLSDLGYPGQLLDAIKSLSEATAGAFLIAGPAGSGKTTTAYAFLRSLVQADTRRSIVSLEDPIEVAVDGVAQSQVNESTGFDLATGLRSLVRQDPEVMMVGEIRDSETASIVYQASLTGHLVVSTFHAGTAAAAITRLSDMGIEPYLLRSGTLAILSQRLVRQLCDCSVEVSGQEQLLDLPVDPNVTRVAAGCQACSGTGYHGRLVLAELLVTGPSKIGRSILQQEDTATLQNMAVQAGMTTIAGRALQAVNDGLTSPQEVRRVLGFEERLSDQV